MQTKLLRLKIEFYLRYFLSSPELLCYHKASPEVLSNSCDAWNSLDRDNETECKFDNTYYEKTIVTEYELICDKSFLVGLTQTIYMVGTICGLFIGYFSDKYGRTMRRCMRFA